jgi:hypothetical protein
MGSLKRGNPSIAGAPRATIHVNAEISFDCYYPEEFSYIEGCYRLPGDEWKVYFFTNKYPGRGWNGQLEIIANQVWRSGIAGVEARLPVDAKLGPLIVLEMLGNVLGVKFWCVGPGPDSLQLK